MENRVLFLDFDGVLFDTLREVYIVNRHIFLKEDFLSEINDKVYQRFSKFKYLVYNIWMFYYYNPIIFSNTEEDEIENRFKNALQSRDKQKEADFCRKFLIARTLLVKNHRDFWQNLEKPYQFFFEIKNLYENNDTKIIVVSKKNKTAILERFSTYGLNFDENDVFAREVLDNYPSKGDFMSEYLDKNNFSEGLFVDDNDNNLKSVEDERIGKILALWGNSRPGSKGCSEKEAIERVKNYCIFK